MNEENPINNSENTGKDPITGRFLPGNKLSPGKPKGTKHLTTKLFAALEEIAKTKDGNPDKKTYSELLVQRILTEAIVKGNNSMISLIMNYVDGAPMQGIDITTGGEQITSSTDVMEIARKVSNELKNIKTK